MPRKRSSRLVRGRARSLSVSLAFKGRLLSLNLNITASQVQFLSSIVPRAILGSCTACTHCHTHARTYVCTHACTNACGIATHRPFARSTRCRGVTLYTWMMSKVKVSEARYRYPRILLTLARCIECPGSVRVSRRSTCR